MVYLSIINGRKMNFHFLECRLTIIISHTEALFPVNWHLKLWTLSRRFFSLYAMRNPALFFDPSRLPLRSTLTLSVSNPLRSVTPTKKTSNTSILVPDSLTCTKS